MAALPLLPNMLRGAVAGMMFPQRCTCHEMLQPTCSSVNPFLHAPVQALRPGVHGARDGSFRATFEDKPLLSDIVFLRAWVRTLPGC